MILETNHSPVTQVLTTIEQLPEHKSDFSSITFRSWLFMMKVLEQMHPPQYTPIPNFLDRVSIHDHMYTPLANRRTVRSIVPTVLLDSLKTRLSQLEQNIPWEFNRSLNIYHGAIDIGERVLFGGDPVPSVDDVINTADDLIFITFGLQMINQRGIITPYFD